MTALRREPLIWVIVILVGATLWLIYQVEKPEHINPLSALLIIESTVTLMTAISMLFVRWLWHLRGFKGWLVRVPDLRGTWGGIVSPLDAAGNTLPEVPCKLLIRQSLFSIHCVLVTDRARSESFSGSAYLDDGSNEGRLVYAYRARPRLADRTSNPGHDGTAVLELDADGSTLAGTYFTDRCTRGEMRLTRVSMT